MGQPAERKGCLAALFDSVRHGHHADHFAREEKQRLAAIIELLGDPDNSLWDARAATHPQKPMPSKWRGGRPKFEEDRCRGPLASATEGDYGRPKLEQVVPTPAQRSSRAAGA